MFRKTAENFVMRNLRIRRQYSESFIDDVCKSVFFKCVNENLCDKWSERRQKKLWNVDTRKQINWCWKCVLYLLLFRTHCSEKVIALQSSMTGYIYQSIDEKAVDSAKGVFIDRFLLLYTPHQHWSPVSTQRSLTDFWTVLYSSLSKADDLSRCSFFVE